MQRQSNTIKEMQEIIDTILKLSYSKNNVERLVELITDAKKIAEQNSPRYSNEFLDYLQNRLGKEVQQLISDKKKYMNTNDESFIIASFMTLKMGIHHLLSTQRNSIISDLRFLV